MCPVSSGIFASTGVENLWISSCVLDLDVTHRYASRCDCLPSLGEKTMNVKSMIILSAVIAAVALGACRREEAPLKLGAGTDLPVAEQVKR